MTIADALPWLNLLMLPMAAHILRTESRITRIETQMELMLDRLGVKQ
ncbi:hypothetical protein [Acidovorax sp. LjRoot194]